MKQQFCIESDPWEQCPLLSLQPGEQEQSSNQAKAPVQRPQAEGHKPGLRALIQPSRGPDENFTPSPSTQPRSSASDFEDSDSERNMTPIAVTSPRRMDSDPGRVRPVTPGGNDSTAQSTSSAGEYSLDMPIARTPSDQVRGPPSRQTSLTERQRSPAFSHRSPNDPDRTPSSNDTIDSSTFDKIERQNRAHAAAARLDDLVAYNTEHSLSDDEMPSDVSGGNSVISTAKTDPISWHIDGLVQERRNSSALAMGLRLSCTNPLISNHRLSSKDG